MRQWRTLLYMTKLVTIVETSNFATRAKVLLSEGQRQSIATMIAEDPTCGELMVGTGGCRKVRYALKGRGKSGGVRVIYFFTGEKSPTFLLALFAKNEKTNLTNSEKNQLAKATKNLLKSYKK